MCGRHIVATGEVSCANETRGSENKEFEPALARVA